MGRPCGRRRCHLSKHRYIAGGTRTGALELSIQQYLDLAVPSWHLYATAVLYGRVGQQRPWRVNHDYNVKFFNVLLYDLYNFKFGILTLASICSKLVEKFAFCH